MAARFGMGMPSKVASDGALGRSRLAVRLAEKVPAHPELELAILRSRGAFNTTIAKRLGISKHAIRHPTRRALLELGVTRGR